MSVQGEPKVEFGRRARLVPGPSDVQPAPATPRPSRPFPVLAILQGGLLAAVLAVAAWQAPAKGAMEADTAAAKARVIEIVNQPITHLRRTGAAATYPYWFHPGAEQPDFAHADVRQTQELVYDRFTYVASDLNPSEMFPAHELEFNAATKAFYTDRSLPKKKLSDSEMLEINQLYRTIARDQQAGAQWWMTMAGLAVFGLCMAMAVVGQGFRRLRLIE